MRDNGLYEEIRELVSHIVEQTNEEVDTRRSIKKKETKNEKEENISKKKKNC